MKKQVLYVDFAGTLTKDQYWRSLPHAPHEHVQELLFRKEKAIVRAWMRGRYTAEEVNEYVAKILGIPYEELWNLFVTDCQNIRISAQALDLISKVREQYVTVLMTGNMDSFTRFTVPALGLDKFFDHISNSYYEGMHKTDHEGELFARWSDKLSIPLTNSILIDDQKLCCQLFEERGGRSVQTESPEHTLKILSSLL